MDYLPKSMDLNFVVFEDSYLKPTQNPWIFGSVDFVVFAYSDFKSA